MLVGRLLLARVVLLPRVLVWRVRLGVLIAPGLRFSAWVADDWRHVARKICCAHGVAILAQRARFACVGGVSCGMVARLRPSSMLIGQGLFICLQVIVFAFYQGMIAPGASFGSGALLLRAQLYIWLFVRNFRREFAFVRVFFDGVCVVPLSWPRVTHFGNHWQGHRAPSRKLSAQCGHNCVAIV